jgi:hypothetical protein
MVVDCAGVAINIIDVVVGRFAARKWLVFGVYSWSFDFVVCKQVADGACRALAL